MVKHLLFFILTIGFLQSLRAEKMDTDHDTLVIQTLEGVLSNMEKSDESYTNVVLRLGDLYAERARLEAMKETAENCEKCDQSKKDRLRAIELFNSVFSRVDNGKKETLLVLMSHLHELSGQPKKSEELYNKVIRGGKKQYSGSILGQAYAGMGDIYFRRGKISKAREYLKKSLTFKETPRKGYIAYRISWCDFNQGKQASASQGLVTILKSKDLLGPEESFQEEVARDLATFYAKGQVGKTEIQRLFDLTPVKSRDENMSYFATELERLGKKSSALLAWSFVNQRKTEPKSQLEGSIQIAQLQYDIGKLDQASAELQKAMAMWKAQGCQSDDECDQYKSKIRKLITEWDRAHKTTPSKELFQAYSVYTNLFDDDLDMIYWSAGVAKSLSMWSESALNFNRSAVLAQKRMKAQKQPDAKTKNIFESSLLSQIEVSESAKDLQMRIDAYDNYLALNPLGEKSLEVSYQRAHIYYEKGQYEEAAVAFKGVAAKTGDVELRKKAADLALDSLVLAKKDILIEPWATQFAVAFPNHSNEFLKIARRAALTTVAASINTANKSSGDMTKDLETMNHVNLTGASDKERIAYFKDKIILAEKLKNLDQVNAGATGLLSVRSISASDREYALSRMAWVAEVKLDFKKALEITQKLKLSSLSQDERILKLAVLAELAGQDPVKYYERYLKVSHKKHSHESKDVLSAMAKIVRASSSPGSAFKRYASTLKADPQLFSSLALEIYADTHKVEFALLVVRDSRARVTTAGQELQRHLFLRDFETFRSRAGHEKISAHSVKKSMAGRLHTLKTFETWATKAAKSQDLILQLVTLTTLATQNLRTYNEILELPVPRGLSKAQKKQYQTLVLAQSKPFKVKAEQVYGKTHELWEKSATLDSFASAFDQGSKEFKSLLGSDLKTLASVAPSNKKSFFESRLAKDSPPSSQNIQAAKLSVQEDPFNPGRIEKLKTLEKKAGREHWVAFLDARLRQINSGEMKR